MVCLSISSLHLSPSLHLSISLSPSRQQQHTYREQALTLGEKKRSLGEKLSKENEYETACAKRTKFREFLREHVFDDDDEQQQHQRQRRRTIMILPAGSPEVRYRDVEYE